MPQNVLIVDDSQAMHGLIQAHMSDEPWVFHSAFDGPSGLQMIGSLMPDLVLLDVDMPGMNGFEVCRAVKHDPKTSAIPIIFLTAGASVDEKICGLELKAADYITKPFDPPELLARMRAALRTKFLLDLVAVPAGETEAPATLGSGPHARRVNARLSMTQLIAARNANPWGRKPPQGAESSDNFSEGNAALA